MIPTSNQPQTTTKSRKRISLTEIQSKLLLNQRRFRVWVAGRRSGKTFVSGAYLLEGALNRPPEINAYIAPTYRMAKRIAWDEIVSMCPRRTVSNIRGHVLEIEFHRGSKICLFGADNPDSLRGMGLGRFVLDEYADMHERTFPEVIRPMLATTKGQGMFIGTPKGFNHFHELFRMASEGTNPDWFAMQSTTLEGGLVPPAELAAARNEMSERQFKQEFEASFESMSARVFYAFDRRTNVRDQVTEDPELPVLVGIDFNISPGMHAVAGHRVADQVHIFDEIFVPDGNTEELARECQRRYGLVKVRGVMRKRRIIAYPDPTGKRRQTSSPIGQTDHKILRDYGIEVRTPYAPYATEDKINTTNAALKTASGIVKSFIHPRCKRLITGLEGLTYKGDTGEPDKSGNLDHITDAFAYLICMELPMVQRVVANEELIL